MNKNIVLSGEIVVLFVASALVLNVGVFKDSAVTDIEPGAEAVSVGNLMPYGENLDFGVLGQRVNVQPPYNYPKVNPAQDVGVDTSGIIRNSSPELNSGGPKLVF